MYKDRLATKFYPVRTILGNHGAGTKGCTDYAHSRRLLLGISAFCDQHYYGHDCSIKCVGQNGCDGHYSCDDKGRKVCRPGWSGTECTEQIKEGEADCRVYNDRPDFGASSWTGTYNCSKQQDDVPIALNLTKTDGNIAVNGYVTFGNVQTLITGTFAHVAKFLVVQTPSDLKVPLMGFVYTSAELNLLLTTPTTLDGSIAFLGDNRSVCDVHISRQEDYFGGCNFRGSCIRYGTNRNDYYCCCHIGFTGNNCENRSEGPVIG
ncbi:hypothetical protein CHS0354_010827 [Potamilus streckersoni]|uniref:Delta-like protein n=1 Tax=Potamilus streckersoni TaxID=2493646 RepID=A0AAE0T9D7_9BIVA|nr:hypothetical protein CHS0354_010827 [Potamilus streckersoni]